MAATAEETLADERSRGPRAAAAAVAAGVLTLAGGILATLVYRDLPNVQLLDALHEQLLGPNTKAPGLKARQVLFYDDNAVKLIGVAVILALSAAAAGFALVHLYRVVKARRPELPRIAVILAISGAVAVAVAGLVQAVGISVDASSFASSTDQSAKAARDVLQSPLIIAALVLRQIAVFALAGAFVLLSLNGMRVGVLTRFMGILGIIVGLLFIVPIGSSLPIVQAFWLIAIGALFVHRWPQGMPPAWTTGVAQAWPSQQEIREARLAKSGKAPAPAKGSADKAEKAPKASRGSPKAPKTPAPVAPQRAPHPSSKKRKRRR